MLDAIIGKLRSPHYGQLTLDARSGKLVMSFTAQSEGGLKTNFEKTYDAMLTTPIEPGQPADPRLPHVQRQRDRPDGAQIARLPELPISSRVHPDAHECNLLSRNDLLNIPHLHTPEPGAQHALP